MDKIKELKIRTSHYKDYVAVDVVEDNKVLATPIYITPKTPVEIHTGKPSSERCDYPYLYDDFNDKWLITMNKEGQLYLKWLNGIRGEVGQETKISPSDLLDFKYGRVKADNKMVFIL